MASKSYWWFLFTMPDEQFIGAACTSSGVNPDWWTESLDDVGDARTLRKHQRIAMAVCTTCPCQKKCALYALRHPELTGIWGGMNDRQRREIRGVRRQPVLQSAIQN